jgi:CHRD domain/EamA-like transporter family
VGVSTYACVAAAAMLLAGAIEVDGSTAAHLPTPREAMAFGYLAVVVTALAFVLWYSGVRRLQVERAGLFAGLVPVAALVTLAVVGAAVLTLPLLAAHIHEAPVGEAGPVVVPLFTQPVNATTVAACLTGLNKNLLKAIIRNPADYYVNVHNTPFPNGAVRGQLA